MTNVVKLVIDRINNNWGLMEPEAAREYIKALSGFSDSELTQGMQNCIEEFDSGFRPRPAQVRRFVLECAPKAEKNIKDKTDLDRAKEMVAANSTRLKTNPAYKQIEKDHMSLRRLHAIIHERAMIKAQIVCGCFHIGYDAGTAFGYMTWGGDCRDLWNNLKSMQHEVKSSHGDVMPIIPVAAIDWINAQDGKLNLPAKSDGTLMVIKDAARQSNVRYD